MAEHPSTPKRVTSADIARASGVSRATVSYVLNDVPGAKVSERTRELVLRTARELGHYPSAAARSLRLGHSNVVLALVRDFTIGYVADRVISALDVGLARHGYVVLAHRLDQSVRPFRELWGLVSPEVIVAMGGLSEPDQQDVRASPAKFMHVQGILPNAEAGRMQVRYLVEQGHTRLGYAFHSADARAIIARERLEGTREECRRLGIPEPVVADIDVDRPETVFAAIDAWQASPLGITAICCHNDELAIMVDGALTARGLRSGQDLALIGIDNVPSARIALTTVGIDTARFGDAVVERVLALLEDREPPEVDGKDMLQLIVRSTA